MNTVAERTDCHTVREVLVAARDLISDPSRHCIFITACDTSGQWVWARGRSAVRWSAQGALICCAHETVLYEAEAALQIAVEALYGSRTVALVNDGPDGHARILAAFTHGLDVMNATGRSSSSVTDAPPQIRGGRQSRRQGALGEDPSAANPKQPLREWTWEYVRTAMDEGWGIDDSYRIVRDDDNQIFSDDEAALGHVRRRAAEGSPMHIVALGIHER
jgi:hypothetical protein